MQSSKNRNFIIIFWIAIAIVAIFVGRKYLGREAVQTQNAGQTPVSTSTSTPNSQAIVEGEAIPGTSVIVTQTKPQKVSVPPPSFDRPTIDTSKLDPLMVARVQSDIDLRISNLKKDTTSFKDWVDLGFDRKALGDYNGARDVWEYVSLLYPQNVISFPNLGDLYVSFLKDYAKAEMAYKTAIANDSTYIDYYRNLYNLYILENKNAEAVTLLKSGISKNPGTYNLQILLARYYRDTGNTSEATKYYDQAISIAQKQGNTAVVTDLKAEESQLK